MSLFPAEAGDRTLVLAVASDDDHKTIWAAMDGWCAAPAAGDRLLGLVVGTDGDGRSVLAFSRQLCDGSALEVGQRYLAKVVGTDGDGLPVLASFCEVCDGPPPDIIDCDDCTRPPTMDFVYTHAGSGYDDSTSGTLTFGTVELTWVDCAECSGEEGEPCEENCGTACDLGGGFEHIGFIAFENFCYCRWSSEVADCYYSAPITVTIATGPTVTVNVRFLLVCGVGGTWDLLWYVSPEDNNICDHDPFLDTCTLPEICDPIDCEFTWSAPAGVGLGSSTFEVTQPV
jgi:hypothetical protein